MRTILALAFAVLALAVPGRSADLNVLPASVGGGPPRDMMKRVLLRRVEAADARWRARYETLKTAGDIAAYQKRQRDFFLRQLGPLPARTPLNARVTGRERRDGFAVEKVIFESRPKHHVTALLFRPDPKAHPAPHPGVIVPCGHSASGKANDSYQRAAALLALSGIAALVFDPIDQGERGQFRAPDGRAPVWGTKAHTMLGAGSILLGRNTASFEIWDGMRAIDYLQSRPDIDPKRIGCMGNSGGGTQTSYLMALDPRIVCASPSCYLTTFSRLLHTIGAQDAEQNIFGQVAFGMDHADYILMRAPKPTLICSATRDFFDITGTWRTFRDAKRLYTRMGFPERVDLVENDDKHGYKRLLREAAVRWMARWLLGRDAPITEPADLTVLDEKAARCTPTGQVLDLPGARSVYDINRDYAAELAAVRKRLWLSDRAAALKKVRELAGVRPLSGLPGVRTEERGAVSWRAGTVRKIVLRPEEGIWLPALLFEPAAAKDRPPVLYVHAGGKAAGAKPGGAIESLVRAGRTVLAVDPRGIGETAQTRQRYFVPHFGPDGQDVYAAYLLGKSFVGMRAEDILVCARWLAQKTGRERVDLSAEGHVGVPALHAAALEPGAFASLTLTGTLASWESVIERGMTRRQLINAVHGALTAYDLPDLVRSLQGKVKVTIVRPVDAAGRPLPRH